MAKLIYRPNRHIVAPKAFKSSTIISFIGDCSPIYDLKNKKEAGFTLDLTRTLECHMIGVLLVYKIMDFSIKNDCFFSPTFNSGKVFKEAMMKYGFNALIDNHMNKKSTEKALANLKVSISGRFIIAPQALQSGDKQSAEKLNKEYLPQIESYYSSRPKAVNMIFTCFSEIFLNFWQHAEDHTDSIIVAYGDKENIEIACADNGIGILSSLELSNKSKKTAIATFLSAIEKGVTSKSMSNHMGYGLWIIDEIVRLTEGRFHLYSEGYYYQREFGSKISHGKCGFWQGTIVYISLPTAKAVTLTDIEKPDDKYNLHINWT